MQLTTIFDEVSLLYGDAQVYAATTEQHSSLKSSARECENKREMDK